MSNNSDEVIQSLLQSKDVDLVRLAVNEMRESASEALPQALTSLLTDDSNSTRIFAARFLATLLNRDQLLEALNSYVGQSQYYYNVVVAIDRALYCRLPDRE